jgi:hypothetical protein
MELRSATPGEPSYGSMEWVLVSNKCQISDFPLCPIGYTPTDAFCSVLERFGGERQMVGVFEISLEFAREDLVQRFPSDTGPS